MLKFLGMIGSRVKSDLELDGQAVKGLMKRFHEDEEGQGMTEYIIILVLIAIFVIIVVQLFGKKIKNMFKESTQVLNEQAQVNPTS